MSSMPARRFLIVGRANAGKTLLMLNFAEYMGYDKLSIKLTECLGETIKSGTITSLKKTLVNNSSNTTKCLQSVSIDIPVFKGKRHVEFFDSTGISSNINYNQDIRDGMAQTLSLFRENYILLHIIDAYCVSQDNKIDDIDMEVYRYGKKRGNYIIIANKSDLEGYDKGLELIGKSMPDVRIITISALLKTGFKELKRYVCPSALTSLKNHILHTQK